jgi:hypothetical protein
LRDIYSLGYLHDSNVAWGGPTQRGVNQIRVHYTGAPASVEWGMPRTQGIDSDIVWQGAARGNSPNNCTIRASVWAAFHIHKINDNEFDLKAVDPIKFQHFSNNNTYRFENSLDPNQGAFHGTPPSYRIYS